MELTVNHLLHEATSIDDLEGAACYFPLANGRYEVKPGLVGFGTDFGNGQADQQVFQIDNGFAHYRQMKLQARAERLDKYYQTHDYSDGAAGAIAHFIIDRLCQEHPDHFQTQPARDGLVFHCQLTGETLSLDANGQLQGVHTQATPVSPPYTSTLDALVLQIQDDLTAVSRVDGHHWVSAIHLCYPNHWSAAAKIGKDFATIHAPVAGMETMNRRAGAIVNTMITRRPAVRFAWGLSTDTRLNHHPESPPNIAASEWQGRHFDPQNPRLYLRIERQVVWGFPEVDAALFTIRTYFRDCRVLKQDSQLRSHLCSAIQSMSPASLTYKGLADSKAEILAWLASPDT
ncbi:MAG: DUF3445 domain-containing protein [Leptolyngbyaceae cyanobacterium RU_5_1]|nr:DUF3445 domain-containing protein [Leptolyngbyaceae cyanobacterium RU_5_1]